MLHENHKIQISILISKFLLDTHSYALYPVYGYFYVTVAKLSSLNYLLSGSSERNLLTLDLDTLRCLLASSVCLNRGSDHLLLLLIVWKPKISWWILYSKLFKVKRVPAILYHEACDTIDRFGRISMSLEMEKERIPKSQHCPLKCV